jgi:hypothetical protein
MRGIDRGLSRLARRGERSVPRGLLGRDLGREEVIVNRVLKSTKLPLRVLLRGFGLLCLSHVFTGINTAMPIEQAVADATSAGSSAPCDDLPATIGVVARRWRCA